MNVQVLDGIIKLLAIIAKLDGVSDEERAVIHQFLNDNLTDQEFAKFEARFNKYATSLSGSKEEVAQICDSLNKELSIAQKVIVLVRLIEIVYADKDFSTEEREYLKQITSGLKFSDELFEAILQFVHPDTPELFDADDLLFIGNKVHNSNKVKSLTRDHLPGQLVIIRLKQVEMYFLRAFKLKGDLFLNGELLRDDHVYPLANGSVIKCENFDNIYYSEIASAFLSSEQNARISFEANDIELRFASGKIGLRDVKIAEDNGKLIAIMGGSGAGKSTLLNVLNGNSAPQKGQVLINGIDIYAQKQEIDGVIGYVPQDDLLIEELTVYQNLFFAGKLCFGNKTDSEIDALVNKTLQDLGLYEARTLKVGNALMKTISGGQRKRLNIGLELLRQPSVMFVDEPTSGLSSRDSENILDLLRELTLKGKLIFVVIHQPSSELFKMFDKLFILDTGGFPIYYGDPVEGVIYFKGLDNQINKEQGSCQECGNVNPEQIFNIIEQKLVDEFGIATKVRKYSPEHWYQKFKEHIRIPQITAVKEKPENTLSIPNLFKQLQIFITRDFLSKLNNKQYLAINLLQAPLLAFILAFIVRFYQVNDLEDTPASYLFRTNVNAASYIFISVIIALFMGLTVSAEEIIRDAKILKREAFLNLSRNSYLLSKMTIMFGFSFLQTLMFAILGNYIVGIHGLDFSYWAVLFSSACFANMLGLNISSTFNSAVTIYITIPLLLIPQLILGGIVVKFEEINPQLGSQDKVPIVGELMASRWAYEGLMVATYRDNEFEKQFFPYDKAKFNAEYKKHYLLPALGTKVEECMLWLNNKEVEKNPRFERNLAILKTELAKELEQNPQMGYNYLESLSKEKFTSEIGTATTTFVNQLSLFYSNESKKWQSARDAIISKEYGTKEGYEYLNKMKDDYTNERVQEMVEDNTLNEAKIIETKGKIIRKYKPIYFDPENISNPFDFRTHFFAPTKHLFGYYFDTLWFNVGVIWFMSFLLYLTLYFKTFRKLMRIPG